jgi:molybdopterin-guanine dinucleotide biosynthesis protein
LAVLVIAGSGRGAGKTAVGCALIAAMPGLRWVAIKVSPHLHDVGEKLWEELDARSDKDTGRYLAAGAQRSFLISDASESRVAELVAEARTSALQFDALLVESNRIAAGMVAARGKSVVSIAVLAGAESEWKTSLRECVGSMDALVLAGGGSPQEFESHLLQKPVFVLAAGEWSVPELVRFVRERLVD